tara:strand:- start:2593 stop:3141 length:549 start_codon:yes stop_codon:yes gene_type:complete
MDTKNIENFLNSFGGQVVNDSKALLQKDKGETALGKSIKFKVVKTANGFSTQFFMDDYGTFLDKGVSGNENKRSFTNYKGQQESSPGKGYTTKGPPIDILSKWIKRKGIKPKGLGRGRSKNTGQFVSGFAYLISRKIKREGIKSLSFFQKPLGIGFKKLQKQMLTELKLDIQTYLTTFYRPK